MPTQPPDQTAEARSPSPSTVFVTGARGFLGRHAARAFADQGARVVGIGRGAFADAARWGITQWVETEIRRDALGAIVSGFGAPDVIVHCSGNGRVGVSLESPAADFESNVSGLVEVLDMMRRYAPRACLLYPSSAAVYGTQGDARLHEGLAPAPCSPYGAHKTIAEDVLRHYRRFFDLEVTAIRFFSLYGEPLQKQVLWDAGRQFVETGTARLGGTGHETRDFLHVTDAAALLIALSRADLSRRPDVINGGTGRPSSIGAVMELLATALRSPGSAIFSGRTRPGDPEHLIADTTQLHAIGFTPSVDLQDGISRYAKWLESIIR